MQLKATTIWAMLMMLLPIAVKAGAPPGDDDPTNDIIQLQKRISSYQQLLQSDNPDMRTAAIERGLSESSVAILGSVISAALIRFPTLTPQVSAEKGSPVGAGMIPDFEIFGIQWSKDGHSFTVQRGCCDTPVRGQVAGGGLSLWYEKVTIDKSLFKSNSQADRSDSKTMNAVCTAFLKVDDKKNLSGPVTCQNLPIKFLMMIPIDG